MPPEICIIGVLGLMLLAIVPHALATEQEGPAPDPDRDRQREEWKAKEEGREVPGG